LAETPAIEAPGFGSSYVRGTLKVQFSERRLKTMRLAANLDDSLGGIYVMLAHTDDLEGGSVGLRHLAIENSRRRNERNDVENDVRNDEENERKSRKRTLRQSGVRMQSLCCTQGLLYTFDELGYAPESRPSGCRDSSQIDALLLNDRQAFGGRIWQVKPSQPRLSFEYETGRRSGIYYLYLIDCFDVDAFERRVRASGILSPLRQAEDEPAVSARQREQESGGDADHACLASQGDAAAKVCLDARDKAADDDEDAFDDDDVASVRVSGQLEWMNPYGHLSADVYPLMPFFGVMTCAYLMLGVVWLLVCARNYESLMIIQIWVAAVIGFGMIESAMWYYDYHCENRGEYLWTVTVVALVCSGLKRAVSRVFFLIIAMGYGVHRPTLGGVGYRIALLGALYFACSASFNVADQMHKRFNSLYFKAVSDTFVFPLAMLDCFFYWWTFVSLSSTLTELAARNKLAKYRMHRRLYVALVGAAFLSAAVVVYEVWAMLVSSVDDRWRTWWIWEAFWSVLFLAMLAFVGYSWRPGAHSTAVAFSSSATRSNAATGGGGDAFAPQHVFVDHVAEPNGDAPAAAQSLLILEPAAMQFHQSKMQ
jgi:GOST, seven transmembrane domain